MSKDTNSIVIIGRLVRDPEIRYTPSGTAVCKFSIANGETIKQNNEWKDYTNFFDVVVFGNQAINCEKYLKKGSKISVVGSIKQNRWEDKTTNQARSKVDIQCREIMFLTPANDGNNQTSTTSAEPDKQQKIVNKPAQKPNREDNNEYVPDPWADASDTYDSIEWPMQNGDDDIPF
ncbi:MAG: hypothetical protein A2015_02240 [Spirochaetes bacterium GWF1_31_7]|nr:MAG: hypothetical protein A2Y30_06090 [Spirochaetes bacterium GWE1_32_154]OHD50735.1 MAG: hypothetical protein A2015_02240 [Spirochaetes bacterium GWF1_31_7]OHD81471.1 MAG: hypothetical protein A2355_11275 [Spirochaetes bacterium RIFOXYB1_FULL_32_8]HBD95072.1 single-stranded DNA-binding protein [Spirochaetia bacterium]HBI38042.1 single-stranded DNA-binding protein [Spirochaetia bacterium]